MFERVPRPFHKPGKGGLWRLNPDSLSNFNKVAQVDVDVADSVYTAVDSPRQDLY